MAIWFDPSITLEKIKEFGRQSMAGYLGMEWTRIGPDFLEMTMPVNEKTRQPYGFLHGGASCALAETAGSVGSALVIDRDKFYCVGLEINANHVRSAMGGMVTATASALHLGKTTHVWDVKIHDEALNLICVSRLTVAIVPNNRFLPATKM